jgi:hypothetical protein
MHEHIFFFVNNPMLLRTLFYKFVAIPSELFKLSHIKKLRSLVIDTAICIIEVCEKVSKDDSEYYNSRDIAQLQKDIIVEYNIIDIVI